MKNLEKEMKKVLLKSLNKSVDFMSNKFDKYEREKQEKDKLIDSIKRDMISMNQKIDKLERTLDRQDHHLRHNCLLLHSIAESERENTDDLVLETLNKKMPVDC